MRNISQEIRDVAVFFLAALTFNLDSNRLIQRGELLSASTEFAPNFIIDTILVPNSSSMCLDGDVLFNATRSAGSLGAPINLLIKQSSHSPGSTRIICLIGCR